MQLDSIDYATKVNPGARALHQAAPGCDTLCKPMSTHETFPKQSFELMSKEYLLWRLTPAKYGTPSTLQGKAPKKYHA